MGSHGQGPTCKDQAATMVSRVLIQSEILDHHARLLIAGMEDVLDFLGNLEALDHYARVLTLQAGFTRVDA
jgi:hypothetical protein